VPADGTLPESALAGLRARPFGIYLHVPFCTTRCGYCDFNTYTAAELGSSPGASRTTYIDSAIAELDLAVRALGPATPTVSTIFVGGGTPTLLPPDDLGRFVAAVADRFGLVPGAEITTESNPESIDGAGLVRLVQHARIHPDLVRHAIGGAARAGDARPGALARPAAAGDP
jgi:coproporphyrinogen III oxidase-like Fe-S oxidoreductase